MDHMIQDKIKKKLIQRKLNFSNFSVISFSFVIGNSIHFCQIFIFYFFKLSIPQLGTIITQHLVPHNQWIHKRVGSIYCEIVSYPQQLFIFFFFVSFSFLLLYSLFSPPKSTIHLNSHTSSFFILTNHSSLRII